MWRSSNKAKPYNYVVHTIDVITKTHVYLDGTAALYEVYKLFA